MSNICKYNIKRKILEDSDNELTNNVIQITAEYFVALIYYKIICGL